MIKIELRDFMKWAFGEELVHVASRSEGGAWNYIANFAALGTVIDSQGFGGGMPELANVHSDAIAANEAVMLLAAADLQLPVGWNPFPDFDDPHGLIAACVDEVVCRRALRLGSDLNNNLIAMIIAFSVMGKEPDWTAEQPKFRMIERAGKPAWFIKASQTDSLGRVYDYEADGYNARAGRPKPGAFRKFEMDDRFQGAVQARIDWYLWCKAMQLVSDRLATGLKSHQINPAEFDCEVWKNRRSDEIVLQTVENVAE